MVDYQKLSDEAPQLPRSSWVGTRAPLIEATTIETYVVSPKQIETWQNDIRHAWQKQVSSIIGTGRVLLDIRTQLFESRAERGTFGKLFKGPNKPFGKRTALMLMAIADNPVLSNAKYTTRLPSCWYTLYILRELPLDRLVALIEDGTINPDVEQRHAKDILNREKSRNRQAETLVSEIATEGEYPPPTPRLFGAPRPKETPTIHLYRLEKQLAMLVGEMQAAHDAIWRDSEYRRKFQRLIDRALRVTDEKPKFELTPPDEEVETEPATEAEAAA